jgi:hypothetical protein
MWAAEMETLLVERVSATTVVTIDRPDTLDWLTPKLT